MPRLASNMVHVVCFSQILITSTPLFVSTTCLNLDLQALSQLRHLKKALKTNGFLTFLLLSSTKHVRTQVAPLTCSEWHQVPQLATFCISVAPLHRTLGHFGITLTHFGMTLGHFGLTLEHFGAPLAPLWRHFGSTLGSLSAYEGGLGSL